MSQYDSNKDIRNQAFDEFKQEVNRRDIPQNKKNLYHKEAENIKLFLEFNTKHDPNYKLKHYFYFGNKVIQSFPLKYYNQFYKNSIEPPKLKYYPSYSNVKYDSEITEKNEIKPNSLYAAFYDTVDDLSNKGNIIQQKPYNGVYARQIDYQYFKIKIAEFIS